MLIFMNGYFACVASVKCFAMFCHYHIYMCIGFSATTMENEDVVIDGIKASVKGKLISFFVFDVQSIYSVSLCSEVDIFLKLSCLTLKQPLIGICSAFSTSSD